MIMEFVDRGFVATEPLKIGDVEISPRDFMVSFIRSAPELRSQVEQYTTAPGNIVVKGKEGDKKVTYTYRFGGHQAPGTAIAASISAQMLCRGDIKGRGVVAPEGALDPMAYFAEFAKKGMRIFEEQTVIQEVKF